MADAAPWFKFFPRDWLSGFRCRMLDPATRAAYIDLLCLQWIHGEIPEQDEIEHWLVGVGYDLDTISMDRLMGLFPNGVNERLQEERDGMSSKRRQRSNAGKRSARLRAARKKGTHTEEEWAALLLAVDGTCPRCGEEKELTKDHVVPIYQGGSDSIENIQPLCKSCNSAKGPDTTDYITDVRSTTVERPTNDTRSREKLEAEVDVDVDSSVRTEPADADVENSRENEPWNDRLAPLARKAGGESKVADWLRRAKRDFDYYERVLIGLVNLRDRGAIDFVVQPGEEMSPAILAVTMEGQPIEKRAIAEYWRMNQPARSNSGPGRVRA